MGLSLEFYASNAETIGADFTAHEFDGLRDGTRSRAYADFSLHLSPTDLDILSEVIAERVRLAPLLLNDNLVRTVGGIANESGAEVVDPACVGLVAAVDDAAAPELAAEWIRRVGGEWGQQVEVTPDVVQAAGELSRVCPTAVSKGLTVVPTWHLEEVSQGRNTAERSGPGPRLLLVNEVRPLPSKSNRPDWSQHWGRPLTPHRLLNKLVCVTD